MALEGRQDIRQNVPAGADLSALQYKGVKIASEVLAAAGNGEAGFILVNKPDAVGKNGTIILMGKTKAVAGTGGLTAGVNVAFDATSTVVDAVSTDHIIGYALETVAAGEVGMIFVGGAATVLV